MKITRKMVAIIVIGAIAIAAVINQLDMFFVLGLVGTIATIAGVTIVQERKNNNSTHF